MEETFAIFDKDGSKEIDKEEAESITKINVQRQLTNHAETTNVTSFFNQSSQSCYFEEGPGMRRKV